jgi:hypothetical protein
MVNYANGKVYMITSIDAVEGDGNVYIGSTTKKYLSQRMDSHRHDFEGWILGCRNYTKISSFNIFEKYGIENCRIVLLELCSCGSKDELLACERKHIVSTPCVNKNVPGRTKQMYRDEHKLITKQKMAARVICICGASLSHATLTRHLKTEKHKSAIAANEEASELVST